MVVVIDFFELERLLFEAVEQFGEPRLHVEFEVELFSGRRGM